MKILNFFLFVFLCTNVFSQYVTEGRTYGKLDQKQYYLLVDNVNLRQKPTANSSIITKLPIGTEFYLLEITDSVMTINNYSNYWCHVSVVDYIKKDITDGYIWAGFFAEGLLESKEDEGVKFVWGLSKIDTANWNNVFIQVRAFKDKTELSKIEFEGVGTITTSNSCEIFGNKGVKNTTNILWFNFSDDFCAGAFGDVYIFWDKVYLHFVKKLRSGADAPVFSSEKFIFPSDKDGKEGKIIFYEDAGEYTDEGEDKYEYQRWTDYNWTGCELKKTN